MAWLGNVVRLRRDKPEALSQEQIARLDAIGMSWGDGNSTRWMAAYNAAKLYYEHTGHLNVPVQYVAPDGTPLGKWVARQRAVYQNPEKEHCRLTSQRIRLLEKIGMQWQRPGSWEHRYALAQEYLRQHGDLAIPAKYRAADGILLGNWLYRQRRIYEGKAPGNLSAAQREKLRVLLAQA